MFIGEDPINPSRQMGTRGLVQLLGPSWKTPLCFCPTGTEPHSGSLAGLDGTVFVNLWKLRIRTAVQEWSLQIRAVSLVGSEAL